MEIERNKKYILTQIEACLYMYLPFQQCLQNAIPKGQSDLMISLLYMIKACHVNRPFSWNGTFLPLPKANSNRARYNFQVRARQS